LPKKFLTLLLLTFILTCLPNPLSNPVFAQEPDGPAPVIDWQELPTKKFIIVYAESVKVEGEAVECVCGIEPAEHYATFVDEIYTDLTDVFKVELNIPINLRLFPTEESYFQVNPLAESMSGVIAHTNARQEVAIALPRTQDMAQEDLVNNFRHEMTHLFASYLSGDKLNASFQEGIAQYLEMPDDRTGYKQDLLRQAFDQDRLLSWAELDDAQQFYSDPQATYPQALSIVSFLIDRYGLANFLEFVKATAEEPGYRSALEAAYGKPADELETEWLSYLPKYFDGRWQINAVYAYDLSRVTELVNKGAYTAAQAELVETITLLETTDQADTLTEAESLLARAHKGQSAGVLADEARLALQAGNYPVAIEKGNAAIAAYQQLGYEARIPEIEVHLHRARIGQKALDQLAYGEQLLDSFHFVEAERTIYEATVLLQSLDNQAAAQRGIELLHQATRRKSMLAYALLAIGLAILLFNGLRRLYNRLSASPLEVEFT
jgi:hypothetical protein